MSLSTADRDSNARDFAIFANPFSFLFLDPVKHDRLNSG